MTPLPPTCVAAVLHVGPCFLNRSEAGRAAWAARVARAVLDAFVAGEGKGPWWVREFDASGAPMWEVVRSPAYEPRRFYFKREADAVAAVLNYLEAKGE